MEMSYCIDMEQSCSIAEAQCDLSEKQYCTEYWKSNKLFEKNANTFVKETLLIEL